MTDSESINEAEQYLTAAKLYGKRGNEHEAARMEQEAITAYVEAGLDPEWTDEEAMLRHWNDRQNVRKSSLDLLTRIDEMVVLSDDLTADVDGSNVRVNEDTIVDVER